MLKNVPHVIKLIFFVQVVLFGPMSHFDCIHAKVIALFRVMIDVLFITIIDCSTLLLMFGAMILLVLWHLQILLSESLILFFAPFIYYICFMPSRLFYFCQ